MEEKRGKEERRQHEQGSALADMAGLSITPSAPPAKPPRPPAARVVNKPESEDEAEDDDDPFGDSNAVDTPTVEQGEPKW